MFDQMDKGSGSVSSEESKSTTTTADMSSSAGSESQPIRKTCSDCGTYKTPLWRGGPAGPKSLCNACGIRSRKRRRALLGLSKPEEKRSKKTVTEFSSNGGEGEKRLRGLTWQISTAEKYRKKLGEEEQAAVLLMAMAYSSVLA